LAKERFTSPFFRYFFATERLLSPFLSNHQKEQWFAYNNIKISSKFFTAYIKIYICALP
jgi:hypothetical protein